ncbi:MAG: hypothetical protein F4Y26_09605, partial [Gammaproteobacteria bacterium]|nr:hypothetical protein [Gammaproteobacteria bacterium]
SSTTQHRRFATPVQSFLSGIDLTDGLSPAQVECLLDALAHRRILCLAGQNLATFSLQHFERFANHWGAPVPHPSNFLRGGKPAQMDGDSLGAIEWRPLEQRMVSAVNGAFPGQLQCLPHESPAVLVVANFRKPRTGGGSDGNSLRIGGGGSWHTDIEYEPLPIYVSMFLVHRMPTACTGQDDWIDARAVGQGPYFEGADRALTQRREALPRNAETCYADTAAAFGALPKPQQERLLGVRERRRLNEGDPGWLAPLVRTNTRSGLRSLHSPVWASRPRVRPPIEVEGMSAEESRIPGRARSARVEAGVPLRPPARGRRRDHLGQLHDAAQFAADEGWHRRCGRRAPALSAELQGRAGAAATSPRPARVAVGAHSRRLCDAGPVADGLIADQAGSL